MVMTKEEWLASLKKALGKRDLNLLDAAYEVLKKNTVRKPDAPWGDVPVISPWLGPGVGIWNWDSAFHARTVSRFDTPLAKSCIDAFTAFQLPSGMLPDVIYADGRICDNYGKPPVLPWATLTVFRRDGDRVFLRRNFDRYVKNAAFWEELRCDRGLFFYSAQEHPEAENYLHPRWESGWDNAVRWDPGILNLRPVDLNCYMVMNYRAMDYLAESAGDIAGAAEYRQKAKELAQRIEAVFWSEQECSYFDIHRESGPTGILSPASFMPLFIGSASPERAARMAEHAADPKKMYPGFPSVAYDSPQFDPEGYWRGAPG